MTDRTIGVAIVGCGRAALQHVEAIALSRQQGEPAGRLVAAVDPDPARAVDLAGRTGAETRTLAEVLADPRVDAISICTPPGTHLDIAVAAARAGKAILIEKPVAGTVAELDAILAAARAGKVHALAMLQHRGRLPAEALVPGWSSEASAAIEVLRPRSREHYLSDAWRCDPHRSAGGHAAHLGVHFMDLACQLLGEPASVEGTVDCRDVAGIDTRAALAVRFAGGAAMTVLTSAHPGARRERLVVVDRDRELTIDDAESRYRDGALHVLEAPRTASLRADVYRELWRAVAGRQPARYGAERARGVTILLEAVAGLALASEDAR